MAWFWRSCNISKLIIRMQDDKEKRLLLRQAFFVYARKDDIMSIWRF